MVWGLSSITGLFSGTTASDSSAPKAPAAPNPTTSPSSLPPTAFQLPAQPRQTSAASATATTTSPGSEGIEGEAGPVENYWLSSRSRRQFTLFAAGAAFVVISTRITARSLRRKVVQNTPAFYHPSNAQPANPVNGPVEAAEALAVASINVFSIALMFAGGSLWAFDVSDMADLRKKVRGGLGVDGTGRDVKEVEEEFEEWLATTLDRKNRKEQSGSIADREDVKSAWLKEKGQSK